MSASVLRPNRSSSAMVTPRRWLSARESSKVARESRPASSRLASGDTWSASTSSSSIMIVFSSSYTGPPVRSPGRYASAGFLRGVFQRSGTALVRCSQTTLSSHHSSIRRSSAPVSGSVSRKTISATGRPSPGELP